MRRLLGATALLTAASAAAGIGNFGFNVLVARQGGPTAYGAVAPLLAVAAVATVMMTATTFAVARSVATGGVDPRRALGRSGHAVMPWLALSAVALVLAQPLAGYLHLGGPALVVFAVLFAAAGVASGAPLGVLLGGRHFGRIAAVMLVMPIARVIAFEGLLLAFPAPEAALLASVVAGVATVAAGIIAVLALPPSAAATSRPAEDSLAQESITGSVLAGALWVIWAVPVAIGRHALTPADAGAVAAVQLMAAGVIYLTSPVVTVFFPLIARDRSGHTTRAGLAATAAVAVAAALGLALLGPVITPRLYGSGFAPAAVLFAVFGASAVVISVATFGVWAGRAARRFRRLAAATVGVSLALEVGLGAVAGGTAVGLAALPAIAVCTGLLVSAAAVLLHHQARHLGDAGPSPACLACLALRA